MSHQTDMQYMTAQSAIAVLSNVGTDTTTVQDALTRWTRVRDAARNARTPDSTQLWEAVANGDQKAIDKAATAYMSARAILDAAKTDTHRESPYHAETMSALKQLVKDSLDTARDIYNTAGTDYTEAFQAADDRPEPSELIVTEGGAQIWADLLQAATRMNQAVAVIKLGHTFGIKADDQGTGLGEVVPYVAGIDDIQAVTRARDTEWLQGKEHAPHRDYAHYLIAGGELRAGDLHEQEQEVQRLIDQAQAGHKQTMIPDMIADTEKRALTRAAKKALKGQA